MFIISGLNCSHAILVLCRQLSKKNDDKIIKSTSTCQKKTDE